MRWKSLALLVLLVIIFGGLAGFVANVYFSQHPILIGNGEDAYNVLRDVIIIVIAVLTVLTAVLIAIVGWALRSMLLRDLKSDLDGAIEECKNDFFGSLHTKVAPLWGRLYEHDTKATYLIEYAVSEAEQAVNYANKLDEKNYWQLRIIAINNYLMALAEKGDAGDANEAYKLSTVLERLLQKYEQELGLPKKQGWAETIYFVRCRLPRAKSNDREKAKQDFQHLKGHPNFEKWRNRWIDFKLLP